MGFLVYDIIFLVLFCIWVFAFLYKRKHNLERQGWIYLYRTQLGVKFIDRFTKRFGKILKPLQYIVMISGFILMFSVLIMMTYVTYLYIKFPIIAQTIKAPPIAPLIPYFPEIFGLEAFFPPLYFTYFLIALAVVAITHEFSHGIFARLNNIKIKSTGFAFLGPILGAFVDPDEKDMTTAKKFPQMVILAAGTFANVLMTVLFLVIMWIFFSVAFAPSGVVFNTYAVSVVNPGQLQIPQNLSLDSDLVAVAQGNTTYYIEPATLQRALSINATQMGVYDDSPAVRARLKGAIVSIDGVPIHTYQDLNVTLSKYHPGDTVVIETAVKKNTRDNVPEVKSTSITFSEKNGKAYLGIGFVPQQTRGGIIERVNGIINSIKDPNTYYTSTLGEFGWFVYYLLWWLVFINIAVALFNMLPLGILDGGRFFYLALWGIFKKEKAASLAFKIITWAIIALFVILMVQWGLSFIK